MMQAFQTSSNPAPRSRGEVAQRTAMLAAASAAPQWKLPMWGIDVGARKPTVELLQEKFLLLKLGERDYVGGQGPMHRLYVESLYFMFSDMFGHYREHCKDLARDLEAFARVNGWPSVPRAEMCRVEMYLDLVGKIAEWVKLLDRRFADGNVEGLLGFFDEMWEIQEVRDLMKVVKKELKEDMAECYISPTTLEIPRLSLVAQIVQNMRDGGVWKLEHRFLEMMVSMHVDLGDDEDDPYWFEGLFEMVQWKSWKKGEEDKNSKVFRAKSTDFVRSVVREMEEALERKPGAEGQNIYGVLEERNEEARNRLWDGHALSNRRGAENRRPVVQAQVQAEEEEDDDEEPAFI